MKLTVIPTDNYQPRIAAAAGAKQLPDMFASDVIFVPNYTSQGLFLDITDRIDALPFKDKLAPSHMKLGTLDGKQYTAPAHARPVGLFWNKDLYAKAGLDPEKGPTTLKEFAEQATTIQREAGQGRQGARHVLRRQLRRLLRLHLLALGVGRRAGRS